MNDLINTIDKINDSLMGIKEAVIQQNPVWYEEKWVIALIGSLSGAMIVILFNLLQEYIKKKRLIKTMVKNLYYEITANRHSNNRLLPETTLNLSNFSTMARSGIFTEHPSVIHMGVISTDSYLYYSRNLGLLNDFLMRKIIIFYEYLKSIDAVSERLEDMFRRFYAKDKTLGFQDIEKFYKKMIRQMKILDLTGAEIQAGFINWYKIDKPKNARDFKKNEQTISSFLKDVKANEIINVEELVKKTGIDIITINVILLKSKIVENIKYGEYKKISST